MSQTNSVLHPDLRGRVAVVTGASRGIGRALAIRLAQEGADVAVAAKSEQSTERLPGSVHETADAIRALGRRALAVPTDVREEEAIRNLIDRTVAELGRIDILVNNAGAIWTQPILQTPPRRFDLTLPATMRFRTW
jgi:citronellol/citronellal dehydrogenase